MNCVKSLRHKQEEFLSHPAKAEKWLNGIYAFLTSSVLVKCLRIMLGVTSRRPS